MITNKEHKGRIKAKGDQLDKTVKAYILSCIDNSGYNDQEYTQDWQKIQFLKDTFYSEYGWMVDRVGEQNALKEYFMGLPSSCNIEFRNDEILKIAVDWGSLPEEYTESQADKILNNWFNMLAAKTSQLFRKYATYNTTEG